MRARHGPSSRLAFVLCRSPAMPPGDAALADVLETIRCSSWTSTCRKRLAARAVAADLEFRRRPTTPAGTLAAAAGGGAFSVMEESLLAAGRLAGLPPGHRMQISDAKALLRSTYGVAGGLMAARLSRLSKGRNALAHLDVGLPAAIHGLNAAGSGCSCSSRECRSRLANRVDCFEARLFRFESGSTCLASRGLWFEARLVA